VHKYKRLRQCKYCLDCDNRVHDRKLSPRDRAKWARIETMRGERIRAEKQRYYHHTWKASSSPDTYCSVIIDGMDQAKAAAPSVSREASQLG
jgi:hypothetical protein